MSQKTTKNKKKVSKKELNAELIVSCTKYIIGCIVMLFCGIIYAMGILMVGLAIPVLLLPLGMVFAIVSHIYLNKTLKKMEENMRGQDENKIKKTSKVR